MKRILAAALCLVLSVLPLAGCSSNLPKGHSPFGSAPSGGEAPAPPTGTPSGGSLLTGFAIINSVSASKDAGDEDGLAQAESNVAAVLVDADGRIVDCKLDAVQSKIGFSKEGKLLVDPATMFPTKRELGTAYGLGSASGIGKEWNEQAAALADYVIGKTLDEVKGIAVDEKTAPTGADLTASVTISIGGYTAAIEKAMGSAKDVGAKAGDKLGIGIITNMEKSTDAGEEAGLAQAYSTYAAASFAPDGKITSCLLDGSQSNVNFDKSGKITTDLAAAPKTKNELGDEYGMKKASSIGKEWFEQAAAFAQYTVGKTADALSGIAVNEEGAPSDGELAASVTVSIGDFDIVLKKAAEDAGAGALAQGSLLTGFAIINSVSASKDAGDEDGLAQAESNVAAVLVDADGRIVDCKLDAVQSKIGFSKEGKLLVDPATMFPTKRELGTAYGLGSASGIGKEWNEQAAALADYVIGKTLDEIKGIAVDEKTAPTGAELSTSVTISIGGYTAAIEKAMGNVRNVGAKAGDKLGIGIITNMEKSTDAGEEAGLAQAYSTYAAASFAPDGKITSCLLDGSQSNVNFDKSGKITTDLAAAPKTKNELGDEYGMKKASSIGKEWFEQAAAFAQYAVGKTANELNAVAVNEEGAPAGGELAASVTVSVGDFSLALEKAFAVA